MIVNLVFSAQLNNAALIQPFLIQLQPNIEEVMDTLEPLPSLQGKNKYLDVCPGVIYLLVDKYFIITMLNVVIMINKHIYL